MICIPREEGGRMRKMGVWICKGFPLESRVPEEGLGSRKQVFSGFPFIRTDYSRSLYHGSNLA